MEMSPNFCPCLFTRYELNRMQQCFFESVFEFENKSIDVDELKIECNMKRVVLIFFK